VEEEDEMAIRRQAEEVEDEHGRHATDVEERDVRRPVHDEAVAEDEVVTASPGPWNVARGWIRVLAALLGVALVAVETAIGFRLAFLLGNANAANGFVDFIYDVTDPLVEPFQGIIANEAVDGGILEPASVIAMVVYLAGAALLIAAILILTSGPSGGERVVTSRSRHREDARYEH
jgi:YggT family protein